MTALHRLARTTRDNDGGVVTTFVVIFSVALIFVTALVVDGGRMLSEHRRAGNLADAAARAGAQAVSEDAVRRTGFDDILDEDAAEAAACAFVDDPGYSCTAIAEGSRVDVTLTGSIDLLMLPGGSPTVRAAGSACVSVGVTEADASC
jgi:Flp pilus assembly protein TadG